jgi:pimeloyl-ACP methyl ester carboxylesterase
MKQGADMSYVTASDGVRIHYEVEGSGFPLVLQHGFTDSMVTWYERGYVDALKYAYRLILIDARGHHLSDKPHAQEAYAEERFASDVIAVLDQLGIERASYWGYSMGGLIGFALGKHAPERIHAIIPAGASPYPMPPDVEDPMMALLGQGRDAISSLFKDYMHPAFASRIADSDMEALTACRKRRFQTPGFTDALPVLTMPALLYAGDADPIYNDVGRAADAMPNAMFLSLPGYGHIQAMMESHAVLPRVMQFLEEVNANNPRGAGTQSDQP